MTDPKQVIAQSDYWQLFFLLEAADRSPGRYARPGQMLISSASVTFECAKYALQGSSLARGSPPPVRCTVERLRELDDFG